MTGIIVLELVPLKRLKKFKPHPPRSWYLGVLSRISNNQLHCFHMGVPPGVKLVKSDTH